MNSVSEIEETMAISYVRYLPKTTACLLRRILPSVVVALMFQAALGQSNFTYVDVHDFSGTDGQRPYSNITFDSAGNAYGTTFVGGVNGVGNVWEITSSGTLKDLHDFGGTVTNANGSTGDDGKLPYAGVTFDTEGDMFGTAYAGGPYNETDFGDGMVWEITAGGQYKDLHDFGWTITLQNGSSGSDGAVPIAGVSIDPNGNLLGDADASGSANSGMVWEITSTGNYIDLHDFGFTVTLSDGTTGPDGQAPRAQIAIDSKGDIFGTTVTGGPNDLGVGGAGNVWEISSSGAYLDLHDFGGTIVNADGTSGMDGRASSAGIIFDSAGDMFGTASAGGPNNGGMVWEINFAGVYSDLHDFGGTIINANGTDGADGNHPSGALTLDGSGDLFGTANSGGGSNNDGMVWELTKAGSYKDLHDFGGTVTNANGASGSDGKNPACQVTLDGSGSLFGTTEYGGPNGDGIVWELENLPRITGITLNPSTIGGLGTSTATLTIAAPAPTGGASFSVHAGASGYLNMPSTVTVLAGSTSTTFTITGTAQRPSTINMGIFASNSSSNAEAILTIQGDHLTGFTLNPSQIKWTSGTSTATLTIATAAPPGGWSVNLTPGVSGYVNIPTSVTIPAGSTSTTFSITGNALRFFTLNLGIHASDVASGEEATLVIAGDAVKSLSVSPSTIGWGGTSTATITLVAAAPPGGWLVNTNPGASGYVSMPSSVTVPAGATSATFTITAGSQRSQTLNLGIYANDGPSNQSALLTIQGDSVKSLTLNPSSISWTGTSTATVTLGSAAPPGGWVLKLSAGASGYVTMPATITVPAGATSATFTITAGSARSSTINLGIFASDGNSTQEAVLTIT